jgi:hypothetical protein
MRSTASAVKAREADGEDIDDNMRDLAPSERAQAAAAEGEEEEEQQQDQIEYNDPVEEDEEEEEEEELGDELMGPDELEEGSFGKLWLAACLSHIDKSISHRIGIGIRNRLSHMDLLVLLITGPRILCRSQRRLHRG